MQTPITITSNPPANKGMDYYYLRNEGVAYLQELSGAIWTDYNEHDPGVTILEQLCYAITDLCYRCDTPITDLLTDCNTGRIDAARRALYIPRNILPSCPWTLNDYRKFIFDAVPKLGNVWFTPMPADAKNSYINGLYEVWLYLPSWIQYDGEYSTSKIKNMTIEAYCSQRNLCEDMWSLNILELVKASLKGKVDIAPGASPEQTLAEIFFAVSLYFAPGIKRHSLKDMIDAGYTTDEIFEGPPVQNGFIKDSELTDKPFCYSINQLIKNIMSVKDVKRISMLDVETKVENENDCFHVTTGQLLDLITEPDPQTGVYSLRLFSNGSECRPDPALVYNELKRLRDQYFRIRDLNAQYDKYFPIPEGQYQNMENYYSIQNQFPGVYGIGELGLAKSASNERKGKAKQLKGYLLVFEQIMADFLSQLENVREFFSLDTKKGSSYFFQYLNNMVPDVDPLLKAESDDEKGMALHSNYYSLGYQKGLLELIHGMDKFYERRNRLLDFILALYGEEIEPDMVKAYSCGKKSNDEITADLFKAKAKLLKHLIAATSKRGLALNYLKPESDLNNPGMLIKLRILLGLEPYSEHGLIKTMDDFSVAVYPCDHKDNSHDSNDRLGIGKGEIFCESIAFDEISDEEALIIWKKLIKQCEIFKSCKINDHFLCYGDNIDNYKIIKMQATGMCVVYLICPVTKAYFKIGMFCRGGEAGVIVQTLVKFIKRFKKELESIYVVELPLLARFSGGDDASSPNPEKGEDRVPGGDDASSPNPEKGEAGASGSGPKKARKTDCSYTIIALYAFPPCNSMDDDIRSKFIEETVRNNTPAHIKPYAKRMNPKSMLTFQMKHKEWQSCLASPKSSKEQVTSSSKDFLSYLMEIVNDR